MKNDDNFEINPPILSMQFAAYVAEEEPDFDSMSLDEIREYLTANKIHISDKQRKNFANLLEEVGGKIRLEEAREKRANKSTVRDIAASIAEKIGALSRSELLQELREKLSAPGMSNEVYARGLEETPDEDLRSLLLDLERTKTNRDEKTQ